MYGNPQVNDSSYYGYYDQQQQPVHYMTPDYSSTPMGQGPGYEEDEFANEPPLLEELGINIEHIIQKTYSVLNPFHSPRSEIAGDADLAGPLVFCLAFGSFLLLTGKIHFNHIYGIGVLGCLAMYFLLSMMAINVSFTVIVSVLGYCILPIVLLSGLGVIFSLKGIVGNVVTAGAVGWCSLSASKLFVTAFHMEHQQILVAYPCSLLYAVFALITIF